MISKNQAKLLRALGQKKYRKQHNSFLVQGEKNVSELLSSDLAIQTIFANSEFIQQHQKANQGFQFVEASEQELAKVSTLVSNNAAIAIADIPEQIEINRSGFCLMLDGVSDPGNLGTIIRLAEWYGISQIVCSRDCADPYNPKTVSATMGSFARVSVVMKDLEKFLEDDSRPIYGAFLDGNNVHSTKLNKDAILIMGSESHGIREHLHPRISNRVTIPAFGHAESLNVAVATGILLDNFARN